MFGINIWRFWKHCGVFYAVFRVLFFYSFWTSSVWLGFFFIKGYSQASLNLSALLQKTSNLSHCVEWSHMWHAAKPNFTHHKSQIFKSSYLSCEWMNNKRLFADLVSQKPRKCWEGGEGTPQCFSRQLISERESFSSSTRTTE